MSNSNSTEWVIVVLAFMAISFFFCLGLASGLEKCNSEINTRECTIACSGNAESIKIDNDCYCKLEQGFNGEDNK